MIAVKIKAGSIAVGSGRANPGETPARCANISFVTVAGGTGLAVKVARYEKGAAAAKNPFRLRALRLDRNAKQSTKKK